jgi:starch synthase
MKLFYITDTILDDTVVHATHINEVCKNFTALGNDVTLFAPATDAFKVRVNYKIKYISKTSFLTTFSYQINLYHALIKAIKKDTPDMIYCRASQFLFVPSMISKKFNIPIFYEVNGQLIEEVRQINKNIFFRALLFLRIFNMIEAFNIKVASGLIVVSQGIKDYFINTYNVYPEKIAVISNAVNTDKFKPLDCLDARKELDLDTKKIYIGYVGSVHSWQGLNFVAESVPLTISKRKNIKFLIVGDGGDVEWISTYIKENNLEEYLELRSALSHNMVPTYINAMDICLSYPLKIRGNAASPFKVYEYLACGKPVVVSDIAGISEEFGDAVIYAEAESPQSLSETLLALIDDMELRKEKSNNGILFIENTHTWAMVTKKILAFFEKNKITN